MIYAVKLKCPSCTSKIEVEDEFFGKELSCPQCSKNLKVPKIVLPKDNIVVAPTESSMLRLQMQNMKRKMDEQALELLRLQQMQEDDSLKQELGRVKMKLYDTQKLLEKEQQSLGRQKTEIDMLSEQLDLLQTELDER